MTTFNTGNPIGSTDARDRLDNSENMDILENSTTLNAHPDRLGTMRKTRKGMEAEHDNQMRSFENDFDSRLAGMAFTRVGTFTAGATLTDMRQTLLWEVSQGGDGHEYGWAGSFLPAGKVVAAGSSPTPLSAGNWVDRTDDRLRSDLNTVVKIFSDVGAMCADTSLVVGQLVETLAYHSGWVATIERPKGGNKYEIVTPGTGTVDGGSFIALSNGLQAKGLFVDGIVNVCQFGAKGDGITDDTISINNAFAFGSTIEFSKVTAHHITSPLLPKSNSIININKQKIITTNGLYIDAFQVLSVNNVTINEANVIGNYSGGTGFDQAIFIKDCVNIKVINSYIGYVGNDSSSTERGFGVVLASDTNSSPVFGINGNFNIQVVGNVFDNIRGYGAYRGDGVYVAYANDVLIQDNKFIKTRRMSVAVTSYATEISITDNFFDDCYLAAIDVEPNVPGDTTNSITITNNKINGFGVKPSGYTGSQYNAIDLHSNSFRSIIVSGNTIKATSTQAASCINAQNLANKAIITGNIIDCNGLCNGGMVLFAGNGFKDIIISNNEILNFVTHGISGSLNQQTLITGNMFISTFTNTSSFAIRMDVSGGTANISNNMITLTDCEFAIWASASGHASISNNTISVSSGIGIKIYTSGGRIMYASIIGNRLSGGTYCVYVESQTSGYIYYSCGGNMGGSTATVFRNSSSFTVPYTSTLSTSGTIVDSTWM